MRRILPYPILSLGLFVASILLSASVAPPSLALAVLLGGLTLFIALWKHGVFGTVPPFWSDFVSFHAAGRLVLAGTPELLLTITPPAAIGTGYCFFYTLGRVYLGKSRKPLSPI